MPVGVRKVPDPDTSDPPFVAFHKEANLGLTEEVGGKVDAASATSPGLIWQPGSMALLIWNGVSYSLLFVRS